MWAEAREDRPRAATDEPNPRHGEEQQEPQGGEVKARDERDAQIEERPVVGGVGRAR